MADHQGNAMLKSKPLSEECSRSVRNLLGSLSFLRWVSKGLRLYVPSQSWQQGIATIERERANLTKEEQFDVHLRETCLILANLQQRIDQAEDLFTEELRLSLTHPRSVALGWYYATSFHEAVIGIAVSIEFALGERLCEVWEDDHPLSTIESGEIPDLTRGKHRLVAEIWTPNSWQAVCDELAKIPQLGGEVIAELECEAASLVDRPMEDDSAFRPAREFLRKPCESYARIRAALKNNPWIRSRACGGRRLNIHAGDWLKFLSELEKQREHCDDIGDADVNAIAGLLNEHKTIKDQIDRKKGRM